LSNVWKLTYDEALGFPSTQILPFETFISNPESALRTLNTIWGVSFESSQLNYQAGFHALISHRAHLLPPQYIEKINDFHRGILDTSPRANQQTANPLSKKHQAVILEQTNETSKKLGYINPSSGITLNFWDCLSWTLYSHCYSVRIYGEHIDSRHSS
jgi:hypothetical protein